MAGASLNGQENLVKGFIKRGITVAAGTGLDSPRRAALFMDRAAEWSA